MRTSGWGSSARRAYAPADGAYTAAAAPLWRRIAAGAVDWVLAFALYLLVLIPMGVVEGIGNDLDGPAGLALFWLAQAVALGALGGYFAYFFTTGHTLGMRALDIHLVEARSGKPPGIGRAVVRALVTLVLASGVLNAYSYLRGDPYFGEFSSEERLVGSLAIAVAVAAVLGHLLRLVDRDGRSAWDRLTGLAVIEDIVPATMPDRLWSPWGT